MQFLIQTKNIVTCNSIGIPSVIKYLNYDFCNELFNQIQFQKEWHNCTYNYHFIDPLNPYEQPIINICNLDPKRKSQYIPVGSVEFVLECLKVLGINQKPINIPKELNKFEYLNRVIFYCTKNDFLPSGNWFIKSNEIIKGFTHEKFNNSLWKEYMPSGEYLVSELKDIKSEYRCFIFKEQLLDIKNYKGDPFISPDKNIIEKMIQDYKSAPIAYTLDVGILSTGETVLIEVHDFFSCGLYGFTSPKIPFMFSAWWKENLKKNKCYK